MGADADARLCLVFSAVRSVGRRVDLKRVAVAMVASRPANENRAVSLPCPNCHLAEFRQLERTTGNRTEPASLRALRA